MKYLICICLLLASQGCSTLDVEVDMFNRSYMNDPKYLAESVRAEAAAIPGSARTGNAG